VGGVKRPLNPQPLNLETSKPRNPASIPFPASSPPPAATVTYIDKTGPQP
jgi:hypothetical protein